MNIYFIFILNKILKIANIIYSKDILQLINIKKMFNILIKINI